MVISNHNINGNIHKKRSENTGCNTRYQCEIPSEYIIRKLKLIGLVYDNSISKVIQFIMEGLPDFWTMWFNVQFIDAIIEF